MKDGRRVGLTSTRLTWHYWKESLLEGQWADHSRQENATYFRLARYLWKASTAWLDTCGRQAQTTSEASTKTVTPILIAIMKCDHLVLTLLCFNRDRHIAKMPKNIILIVQVRMFRDIVLVSLRSQATHVAVELNTPSPHQKPSLLYYLGGWKDSKAMNLVVSDG